VGHAETVPVHVASAPEPDDVIGPSKVHDAPRVHEPHALSLAPPQFHCGLLPSFMPHGTIEVRHAEPNGGLQQ
jgi:hypothetical protein